MALKIERRALGTPIQTRYVRRSRRLTVLARPTRKRRSRWAHTNYTETIMRLRLPLPQTLPRRPLHRNPGLRLPRRPDRRGDRVLPPRGVKRRSPAFVSVPGQLEVVTAPSTYRGYETILVHHLLPALGPARCARSTSGISRICWRKSGTPATARTWSG